MTEVVETTKTDKPVVRVKPLTIPRFKLAQHERVERAVTVEAGTPIEAILDPAYWTHVASQLSPYDHIEVRCDDSAWWALVLVVMTGPRSAIVQILLHVKIDVNTNVDLYADRYKVDWHGPHAKFCVVRLSDKSTMKDGFMTRSQAQKWIMDNSKTLMN